MQLGVTVGDVATYGHTLADLHAELARDPELTGVGLEFRPAATGTADALLMQFGPGGITVGAIEAICAWLAARRDHETLVLTSAAGRSIEVRIDDTRRIGDILTLLRGPGHGREFLRLVS